MEIESHKKGNTIPSKKKLVFPGCVYKITCYQSRFCMVSLRISLPCWLYTIVNKVWLSILAAFMQGRLSFNFHTVKALLPVLLPVLLH